MTLWTAQSSSFASAVWRVAPEHQMHLLLSTIVLRPYVFVFLVSFLFIALVNFGAGTTLLFGVLTYGVGLTCEYSSVHNGFPFGLYHYVETTRGHEIWVLGVPLFDS